MHISEQDVEVLEQVMQDIGKVEIAQQVRELHSRMKWELEVRNATCPASFEVLATMSDSEGQCIGNVEAGQWLRSLQADELLRLLQDEGSGDVAETLYDYYCNGFTRGSNADAWGCGVYNEIEAFRSAQDCGIYVQVRESDYREWLARHHPEILRQYDQPEGDDQ